MFREFQQERPESSSVSEQRSTAAAVRMPKVVLPFRDRREKVGPSSSCRWEFTITHVERPDGVPSTHRSIDVGLGRPCERPPVAKSYDDGPAAMLRDAVISCIHDAGLEPVGTRVPLVDLLEPAIEEMDRGSLAGYESWNVFEEYRFRQKSVDQAEQVV